MKTIRCQACKGRGVKLAFGNMGDEKCNACNGSGRVVIGGSGKATLLPMNNSDAKIVNIPNADADQPEPKSLNENKIDKKPSKPNKTKKTKKKKVKKSK